MMYNNKLVVAIKVNGKVLREFGDKVYIPFGAEYSLLIKNLSSVRAQVLIDIDGNSVTDGETLIVNANQEVEIERSIKGGNLREGNRFKFIERTAGIENGPRGIQVSDGLIRVSYQFEKIIPKPVYTATPYYPQQRWVKKEFWAPEPYYFCDSGQRSLVGQSLTSTYDSAIAKGDSRSVLRSAERRIQSAVAQNVSSSTATLMNASLSAPSQAFFNHADPVNDTGITVPGSKSDQQFRQVDDFPVQDEKFDIVLHLLGQTEQNQQVVIPVTVKAKPKCVTCGHTNKAKSKFCSECGTSLEIV